MLFENYSIRIFISFDSIFPLFRRLQLFLIKIRFTKGWNAATDFLILNF